MTMWLTALFTLLLGSAAQKSKEALPLVSCQTSKGPLLIEVHQDWAPLGAARFLDLVQDQFFTDIAFFRCVSGFLTQFGISENPSKKHWHSKAIQDDANLNLGIQKNYVSFAGSGPNSRSTQIFIAFEYLDFLGTAPWETPFGIVIEGQTTLDSLYKGNGDIPPFGNGPDQQKIHSQGNAYVRENFPLTDFIHSCQLYIVPLCWGWINGMVAELDIFLLSIAIMTLTVGFASVTATASTLPLVSCQTTKGPLLIEVHKDWAPLGAARFLELVDDQFYTDIALFRCVKRFLTQFGISDNRAKKHWHNKNIQDDPNLHLGIQKNYVSFAGGGPNTRSTQLFIAFEHLDFLGNEPWETPFGVVIEGQSTLDNLYKGYGDIPPFGNGPDQQKIHNQGNAYVRNNFPLADFIHTCEIVTMPATAGDRDPDGDLSRQIQQDETDREPSEEDREALVAGETDEVETPPPKRENSGSNHLRTESSERAVGVIYSRREAPAVQGGGGGKAARSLSEDTLIYRAVGFLVVVIVLFALYVRCVKPATSASKAQ